MACALGSELSCETMHPALASTAFQTNDSSQTEDRTAAEELKTKNPLGNGHTLNGYSGNGHILSTSLNKESQSLAERNRTSSSSSSDIDVNCNKLKRNRHKKNKADKQTASPSDSCSTASSQASCLDCPTDLTDSDAEVCQNCFGLRKQENRNITMDEYCPFPFTFLRRQLFPAWFFEPEYVRWHPDNRTNKTEGERQQDRLQQPVNERIHRNTDSLLSTASNFTNYRGLLNLCLLLLVLSNARLCIENLIKYGVLINPVYIIQNCVENLNNWPNAKVLMYQSIHIAVAYGLQLYMARGGVSEWFGRLVAIINGVVQLVCPAWVVLREHPNPVFSSFTLAIVTVLFLKLVSYAHVNYWCRLHKQQPQHRRRQSSSGNMDGDVSDRSSDPGSPPGAHIVRYPDNLTLKDLAYFVLAPTLCYELNFPRSARIRKRFFIKRLAEMVFLIMVIIGLVQQWIVPTIRNSLKPLSDMDVFKCCERLLKLSIPNHFIWLLFFYAFFHSMLNVLAELLKFGDRDFYQDWWNSETISHFWKNWNIPVHRWANRHIYKPLRKRGYNSLTGSIVVFIVSAFFHEYLVSVPLRMFKFWAFSGMLLQVPLAYVTGRFFNGTSGNVIMWVSLIVGQPVAILAYVHDYYLTTVVTGNETLTANETLASETGYMMHMEL